MCTCCSAVLTVSLINGFRTPSWREEILDMMKEMHTSASRLTLKCDNGSRTTIAAFSPPRSMAGLKEMVDGRTARAVMIYMSDVFPELKGVWDVGGEMSSRIG